jgi:hypothetical protein
MNENRQNGKPLASWPAVLAGGTPFLILGLDLILGEIPHIVLPS